MDRVTNPVGAVCLGICLHDSGMLARPYRPTAFDPGLFLPLGKMETARPSRRGRGRILLENLLGHLRNCDAMVESETIVASVFAAVDNGSAGLFWKDSKQGDTCLVVLAARYTRPS